MNAGAISGFLAKPRITDMALSTLLALQTKQRVKPNKNWRNIPNPVVFASDVLTRRRKHQWSRHLREILCYPTGTSTSAVASPTRHVATRRGSAPARRTPARINDAGSLGRPTVADLGTRAGTTRLSSFERDLRTTGRQSMHRAFSQFPIRRTPPAVHAARYQRPRRAAHQWREGRLETPPTPPRLSGALRAIDTACPLLIRLVRLLILVLALLLIFVRAELGDVAVLATLVALRTQLVTIVASLLAREALDLGLEAAKL